MIKVPRPRRSPEGENMAAEYTPIGVCQELNVVHLVLRTALPDKGSVAEQDSVGKTHEQQRGAMAALFHAWERRLAYRDDPERRVLSFEWGAGFLGDGALPDEAARDFLHRHAREALASSDAYFDFSETLDFRLQGSELTFPSPLASPYPENNTVHGAFFPAHRRGPAVVILPQWNARAGAQIGLCRLLKRFGLTTVKLTLPYHGARRPAGLVRAEYMLSPNLGRTLQACRQAVLDARATASWLEQEGYGPLGIMGTSLGSCIAFIAFAHEPRLQAAVLNHISPYFADVVWRGISTRHIRQGLESRIGLEELRKIWMPISPRSYYHRLEKVERKSLLIYGRYDLSFPPDLSREVVEEFRRRQIPHEKVELPCGHYTTAKFPFNWLDGLSIARFLSRSL